MSDRSTSDRLWIVGSDHAGVELRDALVEHLKARGDRVLSCHGPKTSAESTDYPDVAVPVCQQVLDQPEALGLLVCGSGQGVAMSANHVPGIRAALVSDVFSARMARAHNNANVLCFGQRVIGVGLARELVDAFAEASFEGGRHARRVGKLDAIAKSFGVPSRDPVSPPDSTHRG